MASATNSISPVHSQRRINPLDSQLVPFNPVDSRVQTASRDAFGNQANSKNTIFKNTFKHSEIFNNVYQTYKNCTGNINNTAKVFILTDPDIFEKLHTHRLDCSSESTISILDQLECHFKYLNEQELEIDENGLGLSKTNIGKLKNVIKRIYYAPMSHFAKLLNIEVEFTDEPTLRRAKAVSDNEITIERQIESYLIRRKNFNLFKDRLIRICRNKIKRNENPELFQKIKEHLKQFRHEDLAKVLNKKHRNLKE